MIEQTTQTIGKTRAIVISNFKTSGHSPQDKISNLLHREAGINRANRFDKAGQARYNNKVNAV